jgi:Domain of Unknown Function (DUF349)
METTQLQDEFGYVKDGLVYLKGYLDQTDRQIGEVRRTPEEALQYFRNRFQIAVNKVELLHQQVEEAQNKGSYLTKLIQLRKVLLEFDGLGDFIPLLNRLDTLEVYLRDLINNNQAKNLEIKRALIEESKVISNRTDWNEASDAIIELKTKWLKTGPVDKDLEEEVENIFQEYTDTFFQKRREFFAEKNRIIDEQCEKAEKAVKRVQELIRTPEAGIDTAADEVKKIQYEWRKLSNDLPHKRKKVLFRDFKRATEFFFNRYNRLKGFEQKPRVNLFLKALQDMAAEAETLPYRPDINIAADKAKDLLNQWKKASLKVKTIEPELSNKFRLACDKVFEMNYLMRVISYRHPDFLDKPRKDQLKIQIHQMDYLVKKEKNDLATYLTDGSIRGNETDVMLLSKINTQKRKVAVKEMILTELREVLNTLL